MSGVSRPPRILELIAKASQYLAGKGVDTPRLDAEILLGHVLNMERIDLYVKFDQPLEKSEVDAYREAIARRAQRMPVAYITGRKEFYSLDFKVNPHVLIPRPETELLVEVVLRRLANSPQTECRIIELGTGSGAIAVSLAHSLSRESGVTPFIYATDISRPALEVAQENVDRWNMGEFVQLLEGDLYSALPAGLEGGIDVIVSNPPYIPTDELKELAPEIVRYEPLGALDGGADGLAFYPRIFAEGRKYLRSGGFVAVEIGHGQGQAVIATARDLGYTELELHRDYGGRERVVTAAWR
ncbi:MAG TPA: peptide chain release factor N(5)-glutamine methyltransferase [Firmicutes bacterium]|nr:peptide chain release factor N(5)-glutamine methyltransferase [Bacillota bacterium]